MTVPKALVSLLCAVVPFSTTGFLSPQAIHKSGVPSLRLPTFASDIIQPSSRRFLCSSSTSTTDKDNNNKDAADDNKYDDKDVIFEPLGVGVKRDFKRFSEYKSDIVDGLNAQSLATVLFLFFACLAPAIGFGGVLDVATKGAMGTLEMVASTALCGVVYAALAPQPIQLVGPMGPVLAFAVSLYQLAGMLGVPFLPLYAWTGLWTSGMLLTCALTSTSNLVRYLTRFTDEIFSVLISAIFLLEAITNVAGTFYGSTAKATQALLTLVCASITFGSAKMLKGLNTSVYLTKRLRTNLSNFAPAIGVLLGSLAARAARLKFGASATLPALSLPATFATTSGRPWLIPLLALPVWARWAAALPAVLATVLLFLDQNITARLVNNPRYKMTKGNRQDMMDGMHGDMVVLAGMTALTSLIGLPWMAGATTRSAAHVRSLSKLDDNEGTIEGTLENRVSGAAIHGLIGACVLLKGPRQLLTQVPLPVLSGVFLYLGFTSLQGLELWDRIQGLLQDTTVAPKTRWSGVPSRTTSVLTLIQMTCVGTMMWVTKSSFGVLSPVIIALLPLLRRGLIQTKVVPKEDMQMLDE
jgi:hypothetical protein